MKATHQGVLNIGDNIELQCFVLEDGRRLFSQRGIFTSLGLNPDGAKLPDFLRTNTLKPFVGKELSVLASSPITFTMPQGGRANGYEAPVLVDICNVILEAEDSPDGLQRNQRHIAKQAKVLIRSFARVGIIALIDEATGYQAQRARDALNELLSQYLAEELMPWVKRFPDSFFEQICRLRGWHWNPMTKQGPRAMAGVINELVYELLPEGINDGVRKIARGENGEVLGHLHSGLTDAGAAHLVKHVEVLTTLARASSSWGRYKTSINNYFTANTQMELL